MIRRSAASVIFLILALGPLVSGAEAVNSVTNSRLKSPKATRTATPASAWKSNIGVSVNQGVKNYEEVWNSDLSFGLSYTINKQAYATLDSGYSTLLKAPGGSVFENEASDPDRYGLTDTELSYSYSFAKSEDGRGQLKSYSSLSFPTSNISQRASKVAGASTTFRYSYSIYPFLTLTPKLGVEYVHYVYDDSDIGGYQINAPLRISYGLSTRLRFAEKASATAAYSQTQRYDYLGDWRVIQTFSTRLAGEITAQSSLYLEYSWADRVVTNEKILAGENSQVTAGTSFTF